jgi:hypothetical protein
LICSYDDSCSSSSLPRYRHVSRAASAIDVAGVTIDCGASAIDIAGVTIDAARITIDCGASAIDVAGVTIDCGAVAIGIAGVTIDVARIHIEAALPPLDDTGWHQTLGFGRSNAQGKQRHVEDATIIAERRATC